MTLTPNEKAALIGTYLASNDWHGYSQPRRNQTDPYETVDFGDGKPVKLQRDMDCSKLVILCYQSQGIDTGGATYTGDMYKLLDSGNFVSIPLRDMRRGDILNSTKNGHAALYLGDGELVEAHHGDYAGGKDGEAGDQDGTEIRVTDWYDDSWTACYRCTVHVKGWHMDNGQWYYYNDDGSMLKNGWAKWRDYWYYMGENGLAYKSRYVYDGAWYYLKADGSMARNEPVPHHEGWAWAGKNGKLKQDGCLQIVNGIIQP